MKKWILFVFLGLLAFSVRSQEPSIINVISSDSYTLGIKIDTTYDINRLRNIKIYAGPKRAPFSNATLLSGTTYPNYYRFQMSSAFTRNLTGLHQITATVIDEVFGQRSYILGYINFVKTASSSSENLANPGVDVEFTLNPNLSYALSSTILNDLAKGKSAYEVALENGFEGSQAEWLASFAVPKDTAVLARNQALEYKNLAAASASTATAQAGIATTQASTATTQSGIATTQANTSTTQAGIATTAASNASTSATSAAIARDVAIAASLTTWTPTSYVSGKLVNHNGIDYVSNAATISTDVPGASSKWVERLNYGKLYTAKINELAAYSSGKTFTVASGTSGFNIRVGVVIPAGYDTNLRVRFTATAPILSSLFCQQFGTWTNLITSRACVWTLVDGIHVYEAEISISSTSVRSDLFVMITNNTNLGSNLTLTMTDVSVIKPINTSINEIITKQNQAEFGLITPWTAAAFSAGTQKSHNSIDYVATEATLSTDVPGVSSKWVERLNYSEVARNRLSELAAYSSGKTFTVATGQTGNLIRVGAIIPVGFDRKVRVKFTATAALANCRLYWQNPSTSVDLITWIPIVWSQNGATFEYTATIEASTTAGASAIFLFCTNTVAVVSNITLAIVEINTFRKITDVLLDKENQINEQEEQLNENTTKLSAIDDATLTEEVITDVSSYGTSNSFTLSGSTNIGRLDWYIPLTLFKVGDVVKIRMKSTTGANAGRQSIFKHSDINVGVLVWTLNSSDGLYYSQEVAIPVVAEALTSYPNFQVTTQAFNSSGNLAADVVTLDYLTITTPPYYINTKEMSAQIAGFADGLEALSRGYASMTAITVKKNGTGDFTTIQAAINSITDATVTKQYDVQIYDDYDITDLLLLHRCGTPTVANNSAVTITENVALVTTKSWVHIRGMGAAKSLSVTSPTTLGANSFQYIQTIKPEGNCIIDNFIVTVKGGRYAIHQESGGLNAHPDYFATTIYRNLFVEHKGNAATDGYTSNWPWTWAQANGTSAGSIEIFENVTWKSNGSTPFYMHTNMDFIAGNKLIMKNCSIVRTARHNTVNIGNVLSDIGSGQKSILHIENCDFNKFDITNDIRGSEQVMTLADNWEGGGGHLKGGSNKPMTPILESPKVLVFTTVNNNQTIEIVGGTAMEAIFGSPLRTYRGGTTMKGRTLGSKRIVDWVSGSTGIFSLPHRLGNCATTAKTLIVRVSGTDYTITFNQNYMTAGGGAYSWNTSPAVTQTAILAAINAAYPAVFTCAVVTNVKLTSFDDCQETYLNLTSEPIDINKLMVRDYSTGFASWRVAGANEIAEGLSSERVNVSTDNVNYPESKVLLLKKILVRTDLFGISPTAGTYWKAGSDGTIVSAANIGEALFVALDSTALMYIK